MTNLIKDRISVIFFGLSFLMLLAALILIYLHLGDLSSSLIIHINAYTGVDMMGDVTNLWYILLMGAVLLVINTGLASIFFERERVISYIILAINFMVSLFVLINIANIIALN